MNDLGNKKEYETVIGIETHVELDVLSKMFCKCSSKSLQTPNINTCPICKGMPGAKPLFNKDVIRPAILLASTLNCEISKTIKFDRKNYFSIDLPKSYQISQYYMPIARDGYLILDSNKNKKTIRIHDIHMEEDACKLVYKDDYTLVDYNRAGIALLEIVSQADINSSKEAVLYLEKLRDILIYLGVSECKMQEGSFRADINISVREADKKVLGDKVEIKNLNSFKAVKGAIEFETKRQIRLLEAKDSVTKETRRWDDKDKVTRPMRVKMEENDYRYLPEPDIPLINIEKAICETLSENKIELREEKSLRFIREYKLTERESKIISLDKDLADFFEEVIKLYNKPKQVANWIVMDYMRMLNETGNNKKEIKLSAKNLAFIIKLIDEKKISKNTAKDLFDKAFIEDINLESYINNKSLMLIDDRTYIEEMISNVIKENIKAVSDYKNGKEKAITHLIGQTMRITKGRCEAKEIKKHLLNYIRNMDII